MKKKTYSKPQVIGPRKGLKVPTTTPCIGDADDFDSPFDSPTLETKYHAIEESPEIKQAALQPGLFDSLEANPLSTEMNPQKTFLDTLEGAISHFETAKKHPMKSEPSKLHEEYEILQRKCEELEESNQFLQQDYEALYDQMNHMQIENEAYKKSVAALKYQLKMAQQREMHIIELYKKEVLEKETSVAAFTRIFTQLSPSKPAAGEAIHRKWYGIKQMEEEIMRKELELQAIKAELKESHASHLSTEADWSQNCSLTKGTLTGGTFRIRPKIRHESMITSPLDPFLLRGLRQSP